MRLKRHGTKPAKSIPRRFTRNRLLGVLTAASISLGSIPAALACGADDLDSQVVAKAVKTLQSDLMVAALSCGNRDPYNNFIRSYDPHLVVHGRLLQSYFKNRHKSGHKKAMNTYVTSLANEGAIRMAVTGRRFCERAEVLHEHLVESGPSDERLKVAALAYAASAIPDLADEIDLASGGDACTVRKVAFGDRGMKVDFQ